MLTSRVHNVMTRDVVFVNDRTPYKEVVRALLTRAVSAVPVLDARSRVIGMVSEADLLEKQAHLVESFPQSWELLTRHGRDAQSKARAVTAAGLMTAPAITVDPREDVAHAARLMQKHGVKRLPVVDAYGRLVGIVSRGDLLRPYLRSDDEIRSAVIRRVLVGEMCVDPASVRVESRDGVVTLTGQLENEFVVRDTVRLVRELDGVVGVVDHLRYRMPQPVARRSRSLA